MNEGFVLTVLIGLAIISILGVLIAGVKNQQDIAEYSAKCSLVGGHAIQYYEGKEKVLGCFIIQQVGN